VLAVARRAEEMGWSTVGVAASSLPGQSGNVEYFLWLRAQTDQGLSGDELTGAVSNAVAVPATMPAAQRPGEEPGDQIESATMPAGTARGTGQSEAQGSR
jgi:23S rRNA (cytidine1920-2'-O)/16S rRNA (cytidine1409-2'-O)-methyltransferase